MKNRLNLFLGTLVALAMTQAAQAESATWNGTSNASWADVTNWSSDPNPVPGTGDTATFNNAGGLDDVIDLGTGVTINSILFDTSAVAAYTIGSGGIGAQSLTPKTAARSPRTTASTPTRFSTPTSPSARMEPHSLMH